MESEVVEVIINWRIRAFYILIDIAFWLKYDYSDIALRIMVSTFMKLQKLVGWAMPTLP